jgi:transposase
VDKISRKARRLIQGFFLEEALGERIGLSDEEWAVIGPLLPAERGRGCRPAQDNRRYFEGMMWLARTGAQWRHLPDDYGKWNSVFRRYRRWVEVGVFDAMLESLAELVERDPCADMIDSTVVRAHHCAAGLKRGLKKPRRLADRAAASPRSSTPVAMPKAARSASS